jgi:hypothetical protein
MAVLIGLLFLGAFRESLLLLDEALAPNVPLAVIRQVRQPRYPAAAVQNATTSSMTPQSEDILFAWGVDTHEWFNPGIREHAQIFQVILFAPRVINAAKRHAERKDEKILRSGFWSLQHRMLPGTAVHVPPPTVGCMFFSEPLDDLN